MWLKQILTWREDVQNVSRLTDRGEDYRKELTDSQIDKVDKAISELFEVLDEIQK